MRVVGALLYTLGGLALVVAIAVRLIAGDWLPHGVLELALLFAVLGPLVIGYAGEDES